jgi:hypothetical protein
MAKSVLFLLSAAFAMTILDLVSGVHIFPYFGQKYTERLACKLLLINVHILFTLSDTMQVLRARTR